MAGTSSGYVLHAPGETNLPVYTARNMNLRALGPTMLIPGRTGEKFIARAAWLRIVTITGTLTVAPVVRVGNNGTFNNIATVFTLTGAALDRVFVVPIVATLLALAVTTPISIDVSTAATGVTVLTCEAYLQGMFV